MCYLLELKISKSPMSLAHLGLVVLYLSLNSKRRTYSEHLAMFFPKLPGACNYCPAEN